MTPIELTTDTKRKLTSLLTRDEIKSFNRRSNAAGWLAVAFTWAVIAGTFALCWWARQQPLHLAIPLFVVALVILAGRHLALAILHHEAAHKSLFESGWLNDVVGDVLCAWPVWNDVAKYRAHHFKHHQHTNQATDPDLSLIDPFPVSRRSLRRKLARDVLGLSGLKFLVGRVMMDAELIEWTVASNVKRLPRRGALFHVARFFHNAAGMLMTNAILLAILAMLGHGWLYLVWVGAYLTPYPLLLRIRSLAEHACTERTLDMFTNTRTTRAGLFARMTVAPIRVNFHVEHHLMPAVPFFRLPALHRLLRERGAPPPPGYLEVLRIVSARPRRDMAT